VLTDKYCEMVKARVIVMPKAAVLDPQGNAVRDAMRHLGMPEVRSVRIGKYMEIDIKGQNGELEPRLHRLCRDLLSNPVIEDYELQRSEVGGRTSAAFAGLRRAKGARGRKTPDSDKSRAGVRRPIRLRSPRRPTARQASNVQRQETKTKAKRKRASS
jgi:phosphoribosylformylglycinamidine synthase PurS subunit